MAVRMSFLQFTHFFHTSWSLLSRDISFYKNSDQHKSILKSIMLVSCTSDEESHHKLVHKMKNNNIKCRDNRWRYSRVTARVHTKPRKKQRKIKHSP